MIHVWLICYTQFTTEVTEAHQELPPPQISAFIDESNAQYFIFVKGKQCSAFNDESNAEYFIFVEGNVLCNTTRFTDALFLMFASYYIFNLKYPSQVKNVLSFIQDYIFGYPDSCGRSATYVATVSDIKSNL